MRTSRMSSEQDVASDCARGRSAARGGARALVLILVFAACVQSGESTDSTTADGLTTSSTATSSAAISTAALSPPEVDIGVDLESGVIRLAVVGPISDDLWAGHFAYWNSVNDELGGIGGRYEVELIRVDSITDAKSVGALAVSIDAGGDNRVVLDMLVAELHRGPGASGRLPDLTRHSVADGLDAAHVAITTVDPEDEIQAVFGPDVLVAAQSMNCADVMANSRHQPRRSRGDSLD